MNEDLWLIDIEARGFWSYSWMDLEISVAVVSAILSGFFALNGLLLQSMSRSRLEGVLNGWKARRRLDWLDSHLVPLSLAVRFMGVGSNLVLVAAMVTVFCREQLAMSGIIAATGISAGIIALVNIAIPNAWATYGGHRVLVVSLPVLIAFRYALYPLIWIMMLFDPAIRRLCGNTDEPEDEAREEIVQAAEDGRAEGAVNESEVEMIESIVELNRTDAAEIMTPRTDIFAIEEGAGFEEIVHRIRECGHSRIPVYNHSMDNIVGVVYAKDLLWKETVSGNEDTNKVMRKPFFVPETKQLDDLLREFKARKIHMAIVLDEYGGTAGLVTIEDVLEEIVGEIADEYDKDETTPIRRLNENTVEIDGRVRVDELNDELSLELPEQGEYDTVAGYAIACLGYIPQSGETFTSDGANFTIVEADDRKILSLRVCKIINEK